MLLALGKKSANLVFMLPMLAGAQSFTDITASVISSNLYMTKTFGSYVVDLNSDGCLEPFTLSHGDGSESALYIQDVDAEGLCAGTFTYVSRTLSNHSQALPANRVCPMRATFGNFWGDPSGMWGYYCADPGGSIASRYKPDLSGVPGGLPVFQTKDAATVGTKTYSIAAPIRSSGALEFVTFGSASSLGYIQLRDPLTNALTQALPTGFAKTGLVLVMDVDPFGTDSKQEIVDLVAGGYWRYDPPTLSFSWYANAPVYPSYSHSSHLIALDYDHDGDQDIFYSQIGTSTVTPRLLQNNAGIFTAVTFGTITNLGYSAYSGYGNTSWLDYDLDGYPDLLYCGHGPNSVKLLPSSGGFFNSTYLIPHLIGGTADQKPFCGVGDLNNDGLPDVSMTGNNTPLSTNIKANATATENHWLRFHARGLGTNGDGIGLQIQVIDPSTSAIVSSAHVLPGQLIPHLGTAGLDFADVAFIFAHQTSPTVYYNIPTDSAYLIYEDGNQLLPYTPGTVIPR